MNPMRILLALMLAASSLATAHADPEPEGQLDTTPLARRLFGEGVDAARRQDWTVALEKFTKSYELAPRPLTLYNLAGAQVATNRLVRGVESYRRFLRETSDGTYLEFRKEAQQVVASLEPRLASAKLVVTGIASGDAAVLDNEPLAAAALGESMPIDPGQHVLVVKRRTSPTQDLAVVARKDFIAAEGSTQAVTLEVPPPPPVVHAPEPQLTGTSPIVPAPGPHAPRLPSEHHWYSSPVVWAAVIGGAAAIGGGTYLYMHSRPYDSNLAPIDVHGSSAP
jgi:hypothetical protein